jgi:hypothetical protein
MKTKGIIYMQESLGFLEKSHKRLRDDVRIIREELHANTVRLEGYESIVFDIAEMAKDVGLEVWIQPKFRDVVPTATYLDKVANLARKAEEMEHNTFIAGGELSLELNFETQETQDYIERTRDFERYVFGPLRENPDGFREFLAQLAETIRKNFSGRVTYSSGSWEFDLVPWELFDMVMNNQFYWERTREDFPRLLEEMKKFGKPTLQGECGFLTIDRAMEAGPLFSYLDEHDVRYSEEAQARCFEANLKHVEMADMDGVFIHEMSGVRDTEYGIVRLDGTEKKAFRVISNFFQHWE